MDPARYERLSDGQRECLRLFYERQEIKEIARALGIAPVTVNQRLAAARRHLGVARSVDAARLMVGYEQKHGLYSSPIYSPPIVDAGTDPGPSPHQDEKGTRQPLIPLPFPTQWRPRNDLTLGAKLIYAAILAALIALIFGGGVATLAGLSQIF